MRWLLIGLAVVGLGWLLLRSTGARQQDNNPPATDMERALTVLHRHEKELKDNPDILEVVASKRGIIIVTDRPAGMPTQIEGIPVIIQPPPNYLPPPPGVILLQQDGTQEHRPDLDACPLGYKEYRDYRWRFCNNLAVPQSIPSDLMNPPIHGIPYKEAEAIFKRNQDALRKLPGVSGLGLQREGIVVYTEHPELIPTSVEGLPITTAPPRRGRLQNHTTTTPPDLFHGGTAIRDPLEAQSFFVTGTGIVLSEGKPWLVTVAHGLHLCD